MSKLKKSGTPEEEIIVVEHSKDFEKYKYYYDSGFWNKKALKNVVNKKGKPTPEEYEEITGEPYEI